MVRVTAGVHLLVPMKPLALAKTRLRARGRSGDEPSTSCRHEELVLAVARDTIAAARRPERVRGVVAVTSDPQLTEALHADGIEVLPDTPDAGLNAALGHGERILRSRPGVVRTGALLADLPALRSHDLAAALDAAGDERAFCADRHSTGTTLLLAESGRPLDPRFGPESARAHATSGAKELDGPWDSLRCDVDTGHDLSLAARLGLGTNTAALLRQDS